MEKILVIGHSHMNALRAVGGMWRWYGRDLERHFRCRDKGIALSVYEATDPATGESLAVHFFSKQA